MASFYPRWDVMAWIGRLSGEQKPGLKESTADDLDSTSRPFTSRFPQESIQGLVLFNIFISGL